MNQTTSHRHIVVLLLEDDDLDAELLCERLIADDLGATVRRARKREEYEALLLERPLDIILSDFSLPGYDGLAALAAARLQAPEVPFIFVSGAIGEERALETLRRGATDYVLKDRLERLLPAVSRALDEADQRRLRIEAERERDRLLVSERQARELAEKASRMKDEFLAVVSHELRTPLNAILGWSRLIAGGQADQATLAKALATIERNARIQARLIEDLLDISRVITGKLQLRLATVSPATVINAAIEAVRPAATAKGITLTVDAADLQEVQGDPDRLQQVFWNLLSNAVKFTPAGGSVAIRATQEDEALVVTVVDSGPGIDPEFLPYVFDRFRQADATKTRMHGGLGLGLAIVKHLVELHGGAVAVESDGKGRGSRFTVRVPLAIRVIDSDEKPASETFAEQPEPAPHTLHRIRVLVVEDDADTRQLIGTILRSHGAVVTLTASVGEALEQLRSEKPNVIISDIGMPVVDGYSFARRLRSLPPDQGGTIPAIALTAYVNQVDRHEAQAAGFQRHLPKPVSPSVLVSTVAELAAGA